MLRLFKFLITTIATLGVSFLSLASHNRAGEIIYKRINDNPYYYEISIITYTKTGGKSDDADRCDLEILFGYNSNGSPQSEVVQRVNGAPSNNCDHSGETVQGNIKYNVYRTTHTFPGSGKYTVSVQDPNRNEGVNNIPNSGNVVFYLESEIVIDLSTGGNNAPVLQNAPIDNGCVGLEFMHNPGAVDPDGDSLVYSLVASKASEGVNIPGYIFPDKVAPGANNKISIDANSGTMSWLSPQEVGEYNIAILIQEYRYLASGKRVYMGSILRDMQISISICDQNPPILNSLQKQCIEAGNSLNAIIVATDLDNNDIELSATGYPLDPDQGGSILPSNPFVAQGTVQVDFVWNTNCSHVQYQPYWMYFKAKEQLLSSTELVDFETMEIQVVAPRVAITSIDPSGSKLILNWTRSNCDGADGYDIYRFNDSLNFIGSNCNTGVPAALGYEKVGRVAGIDELTFTDNNDGKGLVQGQRYCYMIVVTYPDRAESYASLERCAELIRDVPILNKVSVNITDSVNGVDSVAWYKPIELDKQANPGPYRYELSRSERATGPFELIYASPSEADFLDLDTVFIDQGLNTLRKQYFYQIEIVSGPDQNNLGGGRSAASIYLTSVPSDNTLTLNWNVDVPWTNDQYVVYRFYNEPDKLDEFFALDTTSGTTYVDTKLSNLNPYRYFVKGIGAYSSADLPTTLINLSQVHTGIPKDTQSPCAPVGRKIEGDCNLDVTTIRWNNPNTSCEGVDDVLSYRLYYSSRLGNDLTLIETFNSPTDTFYQRNTEESLAGCYAITAIDSFGNESEYGESLCIDNCPVYELPNVFTPGEDRKNDHFRPFPYKFIESIDLTIYNRWGVQVFHTTDPEIMWDGSDQKSGLALPDGVYYYVCTVNEIRLVGIVQREILDHVTILREAKAGSKPN